jgi:K+-sensing histidine kinase KdpD
VKSELRLRTEAENCDVCNCNEFLTFYHLISISLSASGLERDVRKQERERERKEEKTGAC